MGERALAKERHPSKFVSKFTLEYAKGQAYLDDV
jgi:hypothetical protein